MPPCRLLLRSGGAADHDLRRLHNGERFLTPSELQLVHRVAGDHRRQRLVAYAKPHLSQQPVRPDFLDDPAKLVAPAERHDAAVYTGRTRGRQRFTPRHREQAIDLRLRNAVMATRRGTGAQRALVDPLLDRRVADSEPGGRLAGGEQIHDDRIV